MKKKILLVFSFFALLVGVQLAVGSSEVFADNDLIKEAGIDTKQGSSGHHDHDCDKDGKNCQTTFYVWITYKGDCEGVCSQSGTFECDDPGDAYTTCIDDSKTEVSYSSTSGGYDYYDVTFYPCDDKEQTIAGQIKMPSKKTLEAVAINLNGHKIGGDDYDPFDDDEVKHGKSASVSADRDITIDGNNYHFQGWLTSKTSSNYSTSYAATGLTYTVSSLTSDTTVYAVYAKDRTLTGAAVDCDNTSASLSSISGLGNKTNKVHYNNSASVTMGTNANYTFQYWLENTSNTSLSYSVGHLRSDTTVHAVYCKDRTMTAKAIDEAGNSLSGIDGLADKSVTVHHNAAASITRGTAVGYTFLGWRETAGATSYSKTSATYSVDHLTADKTIYAVYVRNEFKGKIEASGGGGIDWTEDTTGPTNGQIDCDNYSTGCTATFQPRLKTIKGSGATAYWVQRSKNGGAWGDVATTPTPPFAPGSGTNGTAINKTSGNYNEKLYPGEKVCYRMGFYPYGAKANDAEVILTACVTAKVSGFYDKSSITGSASGDTGELNTSNTRKIVNIPNCNPVSGCTATFKHEMKRTNSTGSTLYSITRTSNAGSLNTDRKVTGGSVEGDTRFKPSSNGTLNDIRSGSTVNNTVKLYPGMVVCETVSFYPNNQVKITSSGYSEFNSGKVYVTICASALGNAQPPDPDDPDNPDDPNDPNGNNGNDAFVNMEVRNKSPRTSYNTYRHTVYSKPGDNLEFRATYNPVLQYTYLLQPEKMAIACYNSSNGLARTAGPYDNHDSGAQQLGSLYNAKRTNCSLTEIKPWNNDFTVFSSSFTTGSFNKTYDNDPGTTTKVTKEGSGEGLAHQVQDSEVGANGNKGLISGTIKTNNVDTGRTTPRQVSFTATSDNYNLGTVDTGYKTSVANVRIPYNFINTTAVTTSPNAKVFAGETKTFDMSIFVNPRQNDVTQGNYATVVKEARWKLRVCYTEGGVQKCQETTPTTSETEKDGMGNMTFGKLNEPGTSNFHRNERTEEKKQITVNIPDLLAGSDLCVSSAVFPANSGDARNWDNPAGSGTWSAWSEPVCLKIYKKPSLQVWGGNIYSSGDIAMSEARKTNLAGYADDMYQYKIATRNKNFIFGSWGELGVISSAGVNGLSSGATLGYASSGYVGGNLVTTPGYHPTSPTNTAGNPSVGDPGGLTVKADTGTFCNRGVVLTFANYPCDSIGSLGNSIAIRSAESDKDDVIKQFIPNDTDRITVSGNQANLGHEDGKMIDDSVYYYNSGDNNMTLLGGTVRRKTTKVVHSNKDITITGDITYDAGVYNGGNLRDLPKLVVYAKNIKINCDVDRIDGVLIAEENITTCADSSDIDSDKNSNQLKVNGTIVTDTLTANRTYGAATGANSIVPAEIINYDPSLYLWGGQRIEGETMNINLDVSYSRELAPRL